MTEDQFLFYVGLTTILAGISIAGYFVLKLMGKDPGYMAFVVVFEFLSWNDRLQEDVRRRRGEQIQLKSRK